LRTHPDSWWRLARRCTNGRNPTPCTTPVTFRCRAAAGGAESYARAIGCLGSPLAQAALFGVLASFCYHLLNGVRHLFFDVGVGFERATARRSARIVSVAAVILAIVAWFVLRHSLGGGA